MIEILIGALLAYSMVWAVANVAADIIAASTGRTNPRVERAKARAKKRGTNPYWQSIRNELTAWLDDVVADARTEAGRRREEKRARQAEERRQRDREEHPTVDAEFTIDEPGSGSSSPEPDPPPDTSQEEAPTPHDELDDDECTYDICPIHSKPKQQDTSDNGGKAMSGYEGGLDGFLAYLDDCAAKLQTYQSEQVVSQMVNGDMGPESVAKVQAAQARAAEAAALFADASSFIAGENKGAQEHTTTETANKDMLLNR
jgi:hypothetical protein